MQNSYTAGNIAHKIVQKNLKNMAVIQPRLTHIPYQCAKCSDDRTLINITTRASREMTSRKNIKIFDFNGVNVAKHWHVAGEVFAISDCLVTRCINCGVCLFLMHGKNKHRRIVWKFSIMFIQALQNSRSLPI